VYTPIFTQNILRFFAAGVIISSAGLKAFHFQPDPALSISGLSDISACRSRTAVAATNQRPLVADDVISASGGAMMAAVT